MYAGINRLCEAFEALPFADREYLVIAACGATGWSERNGEESDKRKVNISDFRKELMYLADEVRVYEPFLIKGLLAYLIELWTDFADHKQMHKSKATFLKIADDLDEELIVPPEQRKHQQSDQSVLNMKSFTEDAANSANKDREQAERVLRLLVKLREELSFEFFAKHDS
jgi:hypothetical protein